MAELVVASFFIALAIESGAKDSLPQWTGGYLALHHDMYKTPHVWALSAVVDAYVARAVLLNTMQKDST